ncbi:MAG: hypothetical protein PHE02_07740 [Lachnospiraceae bacterium]|nr:hypothetical protein [Lachnospiraceae bacterium]
MDKFQKIVVVFLCFIMICSMSIQAFAVEGDGSYEGDAQVITEEDPEAEPEPAVTTKQPTPNAVLDLAAMTLSNLPSGAKYSVNSGDTWIATQYVTESLEAVSGQMNPGGTILVYLPGVKGKSTDSDRQTINMGKASRPGGFQVTHITALGGTGLIAGFVPEKMELSYDAGSSWSVVHDQTVTVSEAGDYDIRTRSYGTDFASEPTVVTVEVQIPQPKSKEPTPKAIFDARQLTLYDIPYNSAYSMDNGSHWKDAAGSEAISNAVPGMTIRVKTFGDGEQTEDSEEQYISLTKQNPPTGITAIPASSSTGLGGLDHLNTTMEFRAQGTDNWRGAGGSSVSGLTPGVYEVRVAASGSKFDSDSIQITVPIAPQKIKETTPSGRFDALSMTLNNISVGMAYSFDGGRNFTTINDNHCTSVTLSNDNALTAMANNGIRLKMLGNGITTLDSDVQVIGINKANPPSDLSTKKTTFDAGAIYNVNSNMEYAKENSGWKNIDGSTVTNLTPGDYYVRYKASESTLASDSVRVNVGKKSTSVKQATPTANFDAGNMTLYNIRNVKYSLDGGDHWNYYNDRDTITLSESSLNTAKGIRLYRPGDGKSTTDSDVQIIKLSKASAPATLSVVNATPTSPGVINGVNHNMEYKPVNGSAWTVIQGVTLTDLQPATYLVRSCGNYNVLPSDAVGVLVGMNQGTVTNKQPTNTTTAKPTETTDNTTGNAAGKNTGKTDEKTAETEVIQEQEMQTESQTDSRGESESTNADPVLVSDSSVQGWDSIRENIVEGQPVLIEMHETSAIPATVIQAAKEANADIYVGMDNHVMWTILSDTIEDTSNDIDLGIKDTAVSIPDTLVSKAAKLGKVSREFDIAYEGPFGFSASLTIPVKSGTTEQYANLIYYNPVSEDLELVSSCDIDDSGYASFEMRHASSYLVVISNAPITTLETKAQPEAKTTSVTNIEEKGSGKVVFILLICVVILITIILVNLTLYITKKANKRNSHHKK